MSNSLSLTHLRIFSLISMCNFLAAGVMGLLLRLAGAGVALPFDLQYMLHGHSHVASLGFSYLIIFSMMSYFFINKLPAEVTRLFAVTEISVVGMMISFPLQGYGLFSVIFSALHVICSYRFVFLLLRKGSFENEPEMISARLSGIFLLIATLGIWALAASMKIYGKNSIAYLFCIQFYLHFMFNGFFIFSMISLLIRSLNDHLEASAHDKLSKGIKYLAGSVIFGVVLPVMWFTESLWLNVTYMISVMLQAAGLFILASALLRPVLEITKENAGVLSALFAFALLGFILKLLMQILILHPALFAAATGIRTLYIGFIHLAMLGVVTGLILAILCGIIRDILNSTAFRFGAWLFMFSVIGTELLIFVQGATSAFSLSPVALYYRALFTVSALIVASIALFILALTRAEPAKVISAMQNSGDYSQRNLTI